MAKNTNDAKDTNGTNIINNTKSTVYHKKKIPKKVKEEVWYTNIGKTYEDKCYVSWCSNKINVFNFHVGHDIPESKGGTDEISNLKPICDRCNLSMGHNYTIKEWTVKFDKSSNNTNKTNKTNKMKGYFDVLKYISWFVLLYLCFVKFDNLDNLDIGKMNVDENVEEVNIDEEVNIVLEVNIVEEKNILNDIIENITYYFYNYNYNFN